MCYEALVKSGAMPLEKLVALMTCNPARLLDLDAGTLSCGASADFVLIDLDAEYVYGKTFSRSSNSPWFGKKLCAKVMQTFVDGRRVYSAENGIEV